MPITATTMTLTDKSSTDAFIDKLLFYCGIVKTEQQKESETIFKTQIEIKIHVNVFVDDQAFTKVNERDE